MATETCMTEIRERFQGNYTPEPNSGCWLWERTIHPTGYGKAWDGKKVVYAHRLSYELHVGAIPEGMVLDHLCRVRSCVNPDHLQPVSQYENIARGQSFSAVNGRKTHCVHGHALTGDNLYERPEGWRGCKTCKRLAATKYAQASRAS